MTKNAKAMSIIFCGLDRNEYNRVSSCDTAKQIWDRLLVTHEGTNQVRASKVSILVHNYELFKMHDDVTISEMFTRFTNIINGLKSLGKVYPNAEMVEKILRCLPERWEAKATAIQEAKDLTTMTLEELLGNLMTYELNKKKINVDEGKKKKDIALKASTKKKQSKEESSSEDEEQMAYMSCQFKSFLKTKKGRKFYKKEEHKGKSSRRKEKSSSSEEENDEDKHKDVTCYECHKPGHIKRIVLYSRRRTKRSIKRRP